MADDMGTTIRASLEMVGKWVDQGLLTGINTADAGYLKLMQSTSKWASASTAGTQQVNASMQNATNGITGYVQRFTSAMQSYGNSLQQYSSVATNVLNNLAGRAAQPANPTAGISRAMTMQIGGMFSLITAARSLSRSLTELDLLQASYARIVGASEGTEAAVGLTANAMKDATAIAFQYGASIKDVMSTMVELARLGNTPEQVRYLTQSLGELRLLLASGTGELLTMSRAMGSVVTMMNQFDASVFEAINGMRLMAEYDIRTATSFDQIQLAMNRFAGAAKTANMTLTETIQVATAATEIGVGGSRAGTMLNSVLARVGSNKDAIQMMKQLGVSTVTVKDGMLAAASSMDQLLEAYRKAIATGVNMREFAQAFAGLRLQSPFLATMSVLDRRTRLQVDEAGFKDYTDKLEQSLREAVSQAQIAVPLSIAPELDAETIRARLKAGIDTLLSTLRTDYDATKNINVGDFTSYVRDWLGVDRNEATQIIEQYSDLFGSLQSTIDKYATSVESSYTTMRKAAEAQTKEAQDEQKKMIESMADTLEVAQARLKVAWDATFANAGAIEMYKVGLEQLTSAAVILGNTLMNTFNFAFSLGGLIEVETGLRTVGGLIQLYFGAKVAMMLGDLFSGAINGLGVMATRISQAASGLASLRTAGPGRDFMTNSAKFFSTIDTNLIHANAQMASLNQQVANLGNIKMNPLNIPVDLKGFREQISTALKSGWSGAGGSAGGLDAALRMTTGTLNSLKDTELTLGNIGKALDRVMLGPRKGQGVLQQDLTAIAKIIGPQSQNINAAIAGYDQIKSIWGSLAAEVPKLDQTMQHVSRIINSPFASQQLRQSAANVQAFTQNALGAYYNFSSEVNRILGEIGKGTLFPKDGIKQIEDLAKGVKTALQTANTEGAKLRTVFNGVTVALGTAFTTISAIVGIVGTLVAAWNLFLYAVRLAADWMNETKQRAAELRDALQAAGHLEMDIDTQFERLEKRMENASLSAQALHDDLIKLGQSPTVIDAVVNLVIKTTGMTGGASSITAAVDETLREYVQAMVKGMSGDAEAVITLSDKLVNKIATMTDLTKEQRDTLRAGFQEAFSLGGFDETLMVDRLKKLKADVQAIMGDKEDIKTDIGEAQSQAIANAGRAISLVNSNLLGFAAEVAQAGGNAMAGVTTAIWAGFDKITQVEYQKLQSLLDSSPAAANDINQMMRPAAIAILEVVNANGTLKKSLTDMYGSADAAALQFTDLYKWLTTMFDQIAASELPGASEEATNAAMDATKVIRQLLSGTKAHSVIAEQSTLDKQFEDTNAAKLDEALQLMTDAEKSWDVALEKANQLAGMDDWEITINKMMEGYGEIIDARVQATETSVAILKNALAEVERQIADAKSMGADTKELTDRANELKTQMREAQQNITQMYADKLASSASTSFDDALIGMMGGRDTLRDQGVTSQQMDDASKVMVTEGTKIIASMLKWEDAQSIANEATGEAKAAAQAEADRLRTEFFTNLNTMLEALGKINAEIQKGVTEAFGKMFTEGTAVITDASKQATIKPSADPSKASGVIGSLLSTGSLFVDLMVRAGEAGGQAFVKKYDDYYKSVGKDDSPKPTVYTPPRSGRQTDPIKDAISQIEAEQKQALTDLEIAYRTLTDAEGNIVKYLDRTETVEYVNKQIEIKTAGIEQLEAQLRKATDPKHVVPLQTKIKQLSLEKVKLQADIDLTGVKRKIADLEFSIDVLEEGADAASDGANFEAARTFYQEAYERKLQILDEKMARVDKETLEYQSLELEKQSLQMERHTKLAGLMADEYERAFESEEKRSRIETFNTKFAMKASVLYNWDEINAQMRVLGSVYENADAMLAEEMNRLHDRIAEARAKIEAEADSFGYTGDVRDAYRTKRMGETEGLDINPFLDSVKRDIEDAINDVDVSVIKPGQKIFDPISKEWIAPTIRNVESYHKNAMAAMEAEYIKFEATLRAMYTGDPTAEGKIQKALSEWREMKIAEIEATERDLNESFAMVYMAIGDALKSGWEEGFNIGLEHGITPEGWAELKKSIKKNIASQVSQVLQNMIAKELTTVLTDMFTEMFKGLPDILGQSIGGILGPMAGGVIGSLLGFLIGGMFTDFIEEQAEAQLKQQKDSVNAQGFGWSYQESDQATPYYQFAPDVTKESVNIINFRTTFNISTDAAQAMMAQRRELERVCTEIFNSMAKAASSTFGPKSAV